MWQITACDAASSFALAQVFIGAPRVEVADDFLRERVVPFFRKTGRPSAAYRNTAADFNGFLSGGMTVTNQKGKADISTLEKTGHLYFAPTGRKRSFNRLPSSNLAGEPGGRAACPDRP